MEDQTQTAETQPESQVQADEPKAEQAVKKIAGFTIIRRSDVDPMAPFHLVAAGLEEEEGADNLDKVSAARLKKAIIAKWKAGSARVEAEKDGTFRVYRVTPKPARKMAAKKPAVEPVEVSTDKKPATKKGGK